MHRLPLFLALALLTTNAIAAEPKTKTPPEVAAHTVSIVSSLDHTPQKALFYVPPEAKPGSATRVPLLVALHTWSSDYTQSITYLKPARKRGWIMVAPNFRGPNQQPDACASDLAVQDVLDAVDYAKQHAAVDESRVYLIGGSGGGHMSLVMAGRAPQVWAGVSAWVPIADLAAWHAETSTAKRRYAEMLEKACGGPPSPATEKQYRARSPLYLLPKAAGVVLDINAGIHDGYTGSVPVSHTLRAFNVLAEANQLPARKLTDAQIDEFRRRQAVPAALAGETEVDPAREKAILFRRVAGPVRVTIFEGGHDQETGAALEWLARQHKGQPADFRPGVKQASGQTQEVAK